MNNYKAKFISFYDDVLSDIRRTGGAQTVADHFNVSYSTVRSWRTQGVPLMRIDALIVYIDNYNDDFWFIDISDIRPDLATNSY